MDKEYKELTPKQKLLDALKIVENEKGKSFLVHFVREAYFQKEMAIALMKKLVPDLVSGEGFENKNITVIVNEANGDKHLITQRPEASLERPVEI
jgi:hypothetical protein